MAPEQVRRRRRRRGPAPAGPTSTISAGSGSRPAPESAPVSRPTAGSRTTTPRSRSVATLARVAGCSHISVCIAGREHHRAARGEQRRGRAGRRRGRGPRGPAGRRSRARRATRSASWPSRTCGTLGTSLHTSVATRSAGQRRPGGRADELQRGRGGDDGDLVTGLGEPAQHLAGLVRSDAPADAEDDARGHGFEASGQRSGGGGRWGRIGLRPRRASRRARGSAGRR